MVNRRIVHFSTLSMASFLVAIMPWVASAAPSNAGGQAAPVQLHDIHLPASPDLWPPAPGWWLLFSVLLFLTGWALIRYLAYRRREKQKKAIRAALKPIEQELMSHPDSQAITELNILLRQLTLMHFPQGRVASLSGKKWLAFLDESGQTDQFSKGAGQILEDAPYVPENSDVVKKISSKDAKALLKLVKQWIKKAGIVE